MAKKVTGGYPLKKLELPLTPDAKAVEDRDGVKIGIANGLTLTHFLNELFYANFDAELTDEELDAAMQAEYPNRKNFQSIAAYRSYYNGAKHGHGQGEVLEGEYKLKAYRPEKEEAPPKKSKTKEKEAAASAPAGKAKGKPTPAAKKKASKK